MTGPLTSEFSEEEAPLLTLPEPECRAIEMTVEEMPQGVKTTVNAARKAGFDVRVTYSRGPWQHATQQSYVVKQCIRVVGNHADGRGFIASWLSPNYPKPVKWSFNTAHIKNRVGLQSSTNLSDHIKGREVT